MIRKSLKTPPWSMGRTSLLSPPITQEVDNINSELPHLQVPTYPPCNTLFQQGVR